MHITDRFPYDSFILTQDAARSAVRTCILNVGDPGLNSGSESTHAFDVQLQLIGARFADVVDAVDSAVDICIFTSVIPSIVDVRGDDDKVSRVL